MAFPREIDAAHLMPPEDGHRMNRKPLRSPLVRALGGLLLGAAATALAQTTSPTAGVPLMKPALKAPAAATAATPASSAPRAINWDNLVPAGWDPFKEFKAMDLASLNDGDPRANELLARMRKAWDRAPVNPALVGQTVRIPGFVVPLEEGSTGMTEFLLVPYFGACVHTPPPPSNQIIHVRPRSPAKDLRSMDTVWITGVLTTVQTETYMGAASWQLDASSVAPYAEPARR
jgi:hypothetical protein